MDLAPDFDEFCALLLDHHVEFVIVGAHALAFHGAPRFTGDLDILIRPTAENADHLIAAIRAFGFPEIPLTAAQIITPGRIIEMGIPPVQIHVMSAIDGVAWEEVWAAIGARSATAAALARRRRPLSTRAAATARARSHHDPADRPASPRSLRCRANHDRGRRTP